MSGPPLKVLSVCTSLEGGAGRAAYRIQEAVRDAGVESRVFVKSGGEEDASVIQLKAFVPDNMAYRTYDWVRNKLKNKVQHRFWRRYPDKENVFMSDLRSTDIHGALQKLDYDILHLHWVNLRFLPLEQLPKDKPIVWTLHDSWPFCGICHYSFACERYKQQCGRCPLLHSNMDDDLSHRIWQRKAGVYKKLDLHIVAPSRWLAGCAERSSLLGRFPVSVIPNCLNVRVFRPLAEDEISPRWRDLQAKKKTKHLVLFGAVHAATDKRKGFAHLLSALKLLEQQGHKDDFELVVFGASEAELGMDVHIPIHYVGYVRDTEELVSLYSLASVMVVPSVTETFGQTASESLSCETPVVAFKCTGPQEVISHKIDGYLARPYESEDLANGILWCLRNNPDNCLGKAGRDKVKTLFSKEAVGRKYKALYESLFYVE